jgi:hypothetical protein
MWISKSTEGIGRMIKQFYISRSFTKATLSITF